MVKKKYLMTDHKLLWLFLRIYVNQFIYVFVCLDILAGYKYTQMYYCLACGFRNFNLIEQ